MSASVTKLRPEPVGSYDPKAQPTPTAEQYQAFDLIFAYFNVELFAGKLPPVMLTFSKHAKSFGHYVYGKWGRPGEERRLAEIALSPEYLLRDEREVAATIVHEQVHHWQFMFGNASRRGYHNKQWGTRMEQIGLMPSKTGEPGGARTGQQMTHYVIEDGAFARAFEKMDRTCLLPFVAGGAAVLTPSPKKKDESKCKFICPVCADIAWGRVSLSIECKKCLTPFLRNTTRQERAETTLARVKPEGAPEEEASSTGKLDTSPPTEVPAAPHAVTVSGLSDLDQALLDAGMTDPKARWDVEGRAPSTPASDVSEATR